MAVRIVEEASVPKGRFAITGIAKTKDFAEINSALKNLAPGKALTITIDDENYQMEKGEKKFAGGLRRYFDREGLPFKAWASTKGTVHVARDKGTKKK